MPHILCAGSVLVCGTRSRCRCSCLAEMKTKNRGTCARSAKRLLTASLLRPLNFLSAGVCGGRAGEYCGRLLWDNSRTHQVTVTFFDERTFVFTFSVILKLFQYSPSHTEPYLRPSNTASQEFPLLMFIKTTCCWQVVLLL